MATFIEHAKPNGFAYAPSLCLQDGGTKRPAPGALSECSSSRVPRAYSGVE